MILDQGIGAHDAQVEYLGMGWVRTWVSGEGAVAATIVGSWSNVIECRSVNQRIECESSNKRLSNA